MYTNIWGCDIYSGGYYTNSPAKASAALGGLAYCNNPEPQYFLAALYFILFTMVAAFCILSLFIGTISDSMGSCMKEMHVENRTKLAEEAKKTIHKEIDVYHAPILTPKLKEQLQLVELAFAGEDLLDKEVRKAHRRNRQRRNGVDASGKPSIMFRCLGYAVDVAPVVQTYMQLANGCYNLKCTNSYQGIVILACCLAAINAALETVKNFRSGPDLEALRVCDSFVKFCFLCDVIVKIVAEGIKPFDYFFDPWNTFDFLVTMLCFIPFASSLASILRLIRMFRVLKLINSLPALRVLVSALMKGFRSVMIIAMFVFISFYIFAVVGKNLFDKIDPWHFGTLQVSRVFLF